MLAGLRQGLVRTATAKKVSDPCEIRPGAQLLERRTCGIEIHCRAVVIADVPARNCREHADTRLLVGRLELAPQRRGGAKRRERRSRAAFRARAAVLYPLARCTPEGSKPCQR